MGLIADVSEVVATVTCPGTVTIALASMQLIESVAATAIARQTFGTIVIAAVIVSGSTFRIAVAGGFAEVTASCFAGAAALL